MEKDVGCCQFVKESPYHLVVTQNFLDSLNRIGKAEPDDELHYRCAKLKFAKVSSDKDVNVSKPSDNDGKEVANKEGRRCSLDQIKALLRFRSRKVSFNAREGYAQSLSSNVYSHASNPNINSLDGRKEQNSKKAKKRVNPEHHSSAEEEERLLDVWKDGAFRESHSFTILRREKYCNDVGRYVLFSKKSSLPVFSFFYRSFDPSNQSYFESSSICDFEIKPIDFKDNQEVSFRKLLCMKEVDRRSQIEASPALVRKSFSYNDEQLMERNLYGAELSVADYSEEKLDRNVVSRNESLRFKSECAPASNEIMRFDYDPNLIADFEYDKNFRKTTLRFNGFVTSLMHFASSNDIKKLLNENFLSQFPHVQITYSKIRSIESEMMQIAQLCDLDNITLAYAYVFFEKLIFKGIVGKPNRKIVAGVCLLIAAKISDFGSVRPPKFVELLEASLRVSRKEMLRLEIPVCAALDFSLRVPDSEVLPHYQRILFMKL